MNDSQGANRSRPGFSIKPHSIGSARIPTNVPRREELLGGDHLGRASSGPRGTQLTPICSTAWVWARRTDMKSNRERKVRPHLETAFSGALHE
jgi:hypothetical protein